MNRTRLIMLIPPNPAADQPQAREPHPTESVWRLGSLTPDGPVIECVTIEGNQDAASIANKLAHAMQGEGYHGEPIILGLPTSMCMIASMPYRSQGTSTARKCSRSAWIYKLEERLPVAAEDVVADFIWGRQTVTGIAVLEDTLRPLTESLTSAGICIRGIVPIGLLALAHRAEEVKRQQLDAILWQSGEGLEVVRLQDTEPTGWQLRDTETGPLKPLLSRLNKDDERTLRIGCIGDLPIDPDADDPFEIAVTDSSSLEMDALHLSDRILNGSARAPVDLLAHGLSPAWVPREVKTPLTAVIVAGLLLLITLIGVTQLRTVHYEQEARGARIAEANLYHEAFPGKRIPENVRSRLISEHRKLQSLGSVATDNPVEQSALQKLYVALAGLPTDVPYSIQQIRISDHDLLIEGLVKTHGHADFIATAIRDVIGWRVETPRTEQRRDGTVGFTIRAVAEKPVSVVHHSSVADLSPGRSGGAR